MSTSVVLRCNHIISEMRCGMGMMFPSRADNESRLTLVFTTYYNLKHYSQHFFTIKVKSGFR